MAVNNIVVAGNLASDDFNLGTDVANQITVNVDGTTVQRGPGGLTSPDQILAYNNGTQELTLTRNDGADIAVDLSALAGDIFVDGATFDASTGVLTLTDNDAGTPDVTVNLASLLGVSTDTGNILTDGGDGKPFLDSATVCADITANCLQDCVLTDAFGATLGTVQMLQ